MAVQHEVLELALGHDAVRDVEPAVLPGRRLVELELLEQPVVRPVHRLPPLELERAERVAHLLERVDDAVGVVVGRVDAPLGPRAGVRVEEDAVGGGVPKRRVVRAQVAFHAQHRLPLGVTARLHALEEVTVLRLGPIAPRTHRLRRQLAHLLGPRPGAQGQSARLDLRARLVAHVRATGVDELESELVPIEREGAWVMRRAWVMEGGVGDEGGRGSWGRG